MKLFKSVVQILSILMLVFYTNGNTQDTDKTPTVVFVTGGDEYQSRESMPLDGTELSDRLSGVRL